MLSGPCWLILLVDFYLIKTADRRETQANGGQPEWRYDGSQELEMAVKAVLVTPGGAT